VISFYTFHDTYEELGLFSSDNIHHSGCMDGLGKPQEILTQGPCMNFKSIRVRPGLEQGPFIFMSVG